MTRIGLVARGDNTGLGVQSWEFHRHMHPAKTLICDFTGNSASGKDLTIYPDRFPGDTTVVTGPPDGPTMMGFLDDLDVVVAMETPYNHDLFFMCRDREIRTVLQANWEMMGYHREADRLPFPDVLALPSTWHLGEAQNRFGDRTEVIHLPVPVVTDRNETSTATASCRRFVHVGGNPAAADRNGTRDLLAALRYVRSEITVTLTCQRPGWLAALIQPGQKPDNVTLVIESSPPENYWDLYAGQDALILPRRYGGLCLPLNEAIGAGIPAIMPDISPNFDWLPQDWLTPATLDDTIMTKTLIDVYRSDPPSLASRIDRMAADDDFYARCRRQARGLAEAHNWEALMPYYRKVLR
jgi:glycosyltransferase involved in cell wall biosynthesis